MFSCILAGLSGVPLKVKSKRHQGIISQNARQKHVGNSRDQGALTLGWRGRDSELFIIAPLTQNVIRLPSGQSVFYTPGIAPVAACSLSTAADAGSAAYSARTT